MKRNFFKKTVVLATLGCFIGITTPSFAQVSTWVNPCRGGYADIELSTGRLTCTINGQTSYLNFPTVSAPVSAPVYSQQTLPQAMQQTPSSEVVEKTEVMKNGVKEIRVKRKIYGSSILKSSVPQQVAPQQVVPQPMVQQAVPQQVAPQPMVQQVVPQQVVPQPMVQQAVPQQVVPQPMVQQVIPQQVVPQQEPSKPYCSFNMETMEDECDYEGNKYTSNASNNLYREGKEYWNSLTKRFEKKKEFHFFFNQSFIVMQKPGVIYDINTSDQMLELLDSKMAVVVVLVPKYPGMEFAEAEATKVQMSQIGYVDLPKYEKEGYEIPEVSARFPGLKFTKLAFKVDLAAQKARADEIKKAQEEGSWFGKEAFTMISGALISVLGGVAASWTMNEILND